VRDLWQASMSNKFDGRCGAPMQSQGNWDGCTGHDWSGGYKDVASAVSQAYTVCALAVELSRFDDPSVTRKPPHSSTEIVESFL